MAEDQSTAAATKYVVIIGGVVSGLGKGVTASSVGVVLKACGLRVTCIKIGSCASLPPPEAFLPLKPKETLRLLVLGVDGRGAHWSVPATSPCNALVLSCFVYDNH
jgi:hypothetical protein